MAKLSSVQKNLNRLRLIEKFSNKRKVLNNKIIPSKTLHQNSKKRGGSPPGKIHLKNDLKNDRNILILENDFKNDVKNNDRDMMILENFRRTPKI